MNRLDRIIKRLDIIQGLVNKFDHDPDLGNAMMLIIEQQVLHTDLLIDIRDALYRTQIDDEREKDPNKFEFSSEENSE